MSLIRRTLPMIAGALMLMGNGASMAAVTDVPATLRPDPQRRTLPLHWQERAGGAMRYYGYSYPWSGTPEEKLGRLNEMRADGANSQGTNFSWLSGLMKPAQNERGAVVDDSTSSSQFNDFPNALTLAAREQFPLFVGNISCTNFHEYPDWYVAINPGIYVRTASGASASLLYERPVDAQQKKGWTTIENPGLNAMKREFVTKILKHFGDDPSVLAWCMDGESLFPPDVSVGDVADYGPDAVRHFRAWLQRKYGTVEKLNIAWGAQWKSLDAVEPPREKIGDAANVDWHTFRGAAMAEYVQQFYAVHKTLTPAKLAFAWQHDVQFRGFERLITGQAISEYARVGDGIQANCIVRPPRLDYNIQYFRAMSSFNKPVICKEASFFPRPWPAGNTRMQLFEQLGMGLWGTHLCEWLWGSEGIDWGIRGKETQAAARRVFHVFKAAQGPLQHMWPLMPNVRVYISDTKWVMDGWQPVWSQLQYDLITTQHPNLYLFDNQLGRPMFWSPVVVSVANSVVDRKASEALLHYVEAGGTLVLVDEFQTYDDQIKPNPGTLGRLPDGEHRIGKGRVLRYSKPYSNACFDQMETLMADGAATSWMRLDASTPVPGREGLELFPLSDGVHHAAVVVNANLQPTSFGLQIDPLLLGGGTYTVSVMNEDGSSTPTAGWGRVVGQVSAQQSTLASIGTIGAQDGVLVLLRRGSTAGGAAEQLRKARTLHTALTPEGAGFLLTVSDAQGAPVSDAVIDARLVPLFDEPVASAAAGKGTWRLTLPDPLPMVYDYDRGQYVAASGPVQVHVDVYAPNGEGYVEATLGAAGSTQE